MSLVIRAFDAARDGAFLRECLIELQETERVCDPRLRSGETIVQRRTLTSARTRI